MRSIFEKREQAALNWKKKGLIFAPPQRSSWPYSHAALPVADREGDQYRIYFSSRDQAGRAQVGSFTTDLAIASEAREVTTKPVLGLGPLGAFDDSGVTMSWLTNHRGRKYLYYSGWSLGVTVPFYFYIGLAISQDNGRSFVRISPAPILGRNEIDPFLTASPCVLVEEGKWRMWYVSGTGWEMAEGKPRHNYHIKYAESNDGVDWRREGIVCIDYQGSKEYAIARPCVVKEGSLYRMWYCYRGERYRLGYAESGDGLEWTRRDSEAGLEISESGFDSEMIAYPYVFKEEERYCMLYNGNEYGQTGIGLAVAC